MKIYESHHKNVKIPNLDVLTLLFESKWCAAEEETKIHVEAANPLNSVTKAEARDVVRRTAHTLRTRYSIGSSQAGRDVVLFMAAGSPFIPVLFYAVLAAGGVYNGASTAFTVNELVTQIKDANARLLVCSAGYEEQLVEAARRCGIPSSRILVIDSNRPRDWNLVSVADRANILDLQKGPLLDWRRITDQAELQETTACLMYSSGTTGLPKGVQISQWNLTAANVCGMHITKKFRAQRDQEGNPFKFSTIAFLPMAHVGGITWSSLNPFYLGGTAYWLEKYDFDSFIEYHRKFRLTCQWSVPPVWHAIANSPKVADHFDSLQIAISGAAPLGPELAKVAARKLGRGKISIVSQFWGATETTGSITGVDWDVVDEKISEGCPIPNVKLRFVDDKLRDVEPGQPGEVLVSGPIVCQGYHNRPDANRDSFVDGFYRTGDVGIWDDGYVHIIDRLKELIKYKGLQVAPAELEAFLVTHPKILDAAVVGVDNQSQATEMPKAFVVRQPNVELHAEEVMEYVRNNLSNHKRLRGGVTFLDSIPKSASGKILRKELRQNPELYERQTAKL